MSANYAAVSDEVLAAIDPKLRRLSIVRSCISCRGSDYIAKLVDLQYLAITDTALVDSSLEHLNGMPRLKSLVLDGSTVSDLGAKHLAALKTLRTLSLNNCRTTGEGLDHLQQLKNVEWLYLNGTEISDADIMKLKGLPQSMRAVRGSDELRIQMAPSGGFAAELLRVAQ